MPIRLIPDKMGPRWNHQELTVLGRLRQRGTLDRARSEMSVIAKRLAMQYPDANSGQTVLVERLPDRIVGGIRPMLFALFGAIGLVLLIACSNVANLQLGRGIARVKEFSIRSAPGASRARIVSQLLVLRTPLRLCGLLRW